mmetsp:Transcript_34110/g.30883  ORF Transcript_34110/g.30883 Transcript_34110/m.30883 type:complete len:116 (+) Transcript_34110:622-969(+)
MGIPAQRLNRSVSDETEVYGCPIDGGDQYALLLFNRNENWKNITAPYNLIGINGNATVWDMYEQKSLGVFEGEINVAVEPHGVAALRLSNFSSSYTFYGYDMIEENEQGFLSIKS